MSPFLNSKVVSLKEVPLDDLMDETGRSTPATILVVDDERLVADTLTAILLRAGFAARAAYCGQSALQLAAEMDLELLISDVAMPVMNGVELALRLVAEKSACKVLLFSGHARSADLVDAVAAGHDFPLLAKPVHPKEMLRQVSSLLSMPRRQRQGRIAEVLPIRGVMECA